MLEHIASAKALASAVGIILVACLAGCATGTTEATSGRPSGTGGGAKHPTTQEPARQRTAAAPEVAARVASCRRSGRTTMVRGAGNCPVAWNGQTVRVSGNVDVTPGTTERGVPCLRLQIKDTSPVTVKPYGKMSCGRPSRELVAKHLGAKLPEAGPIDVALEDDGEGLFIVRGRVEATRQGLIRSRDPTIECDTSIQAQYGNREAVCH